jgi:hypothetical protein
MHSGKVDESDRYKYESQSRETSGGRLIDLLRINT